MSSSHLNDMKKIVFVIHTLHAGGAERVVSVLANEISEHKVDARLPEEFLCVA
jgi:hypothetical protein